MIIEADVVMEGCTMSPREAAAVIREAKTRIFDDDEMARLSEAFALMLYLTPIPHGGFIKFSGRQ